jgi:hypothetical protein
MTKNNDDGFIRNIPTHLYFFKLPYQPRSTALLVLVLLILGIVFSISAYIYHKINFDLLGTWGPNYNSLTVWRGFEGASGRRNQSWVISYENDYEITYTGVVRHISPIRVWDMPILTHNILITSGDYANKDIVGTVVTDSRVMYYYPITIEPNGHINLIHAIPLLPGLYQNLLEIKLGDTIIVTGKEVEDLIAYDANGRKLSNWKDNGCNTLLITSIKIMRAN